MTGLSTLTLFRAYQGAEKGWRDAWRSANLIEPYTPHARECHQRWERVAQRRGRQANRFEAALVERFKQEEGAQ